MTARSVSFVSCIACVAAIQIQQQPSASADLSCLYFMHVPKTGGTAMQTVLQVFVKYRAQRVQLCYATNCYDPVADRIVAQARTGSLSATVENSLLQDRCATNKIVYGHDVNAQLVETINLPGAGSAWRLFQCETAAANILCFSFDVAPTNFANFEMLAEYYSVERISGCVFFTHSYHFRTSASVYCGILKIVFAHVMSARPLCTQSSKETEYKTTLSQDSLMKLKMLLKPTEQI